MLLFHLQGYYELSMSLNLPSEGWEAGIPNPIVVVGLKGFG